MTSESDRRRSSKETGAATSRGGASERSDRLGAEDDFAADELAAEEVDFAADELAAEEVDQSGAIPEMLRKALELGLAGFFSTEQTIRKAFGDKLPQEWVDFVSSQSERTRSDLTEAIASEVGRTLKSIDLTRVADQLLSGRTLEVSARIRLLPEEGDDNQSHDRSHDTEEPEGSIT